MNANVCKYCYITFLDNFENEVCKDCFDNIHKDLKDYEKIEKMASLLVSFYANNMATLLNIPIFFVQFLSKTANFEYTPLYDIYVSKEKIYKKSVQELKKYIQEIKEDETTGENSMPI